jgi:hypothetical protein
MRLVKPVSIPSKSLLSRESQTLKFKVSTRFAAFALLVVAATAYMSSCKDDIFLPEPRGLLGSYSGLLIVTVDNGPGEPTTHDTDHVLVVFRSGVDSAYQQFFDDAFSAVDTPDICDVNRGTWTIINSKMSLDAIELGDATVCNANLVPEGGGFGFRPLSVEELGDSLVIVQETATTTSEFLLTLTSPL